jgi:low temperature requirement protein LtrA
VSAAIATGRETGRAAPRRPTLYVSSEESRHATWLELFFDLVFVLAIAELAHFLHDDPTLGGFLGFAFLFVPVWWAWTGFTYYADLFDVDGPAYRVTMLAAMLVSAALAMTIHDALDGGSAGFAVAYVVLRLLLIGLYVWAWRYAVAARALCARHILGFSLGAALWAVSLLVPEPGRYWLWAAGLLVEFATPVVSQFSEIGRGPLQVSHLPERYGLFTIIVLGESVVVTGTAVADADWATESVMVAAFGFAAVGCLWWLYFDQVDEVVVERAYRGGVRALLIGFCWAYGHLAIYAALAMTAVGVELAIEEASHDELGGGARAALGGGIAISLLVITVLRLAVPPPPPRPHVVARLTGAVIVLALILIGAVLPPPVLVVLLAATLAGLTAFETLSADVAPLPSPAETPSSAGPPASTSAVPTPKES